MIDVFNYFTQFVESVTQAILPLLPYNPITYDGTDIYVSAITDLINHLDYNAVVLSEQILKLEYYSSLISYLLWSILILIFIVIVFNIFKIIVYSVLKLFEY